MILVLEDDLSIRDTLDLLLDSMGLKHHCVATNEEAIKFMNENSPVILLADMILANGDARPAIKYCKEKHRNCKTILLTAMQRQKAEAAAKELRMDHLLLKPFQIEELTQLLI